MGDLRVRRGNKPSSQAAITTRYPRVENLQQWIDTGMPA
jgi:hypothetical protein